MGMWSGIRQGFEWRAKQDLLEQQQALSEEELELKRENFELARAKAKADADSERLTNALAIKKALGLTGSGTASGKGGTTASTTDQSSVNKYMQTLTTRFGVEEDAIKKVYATGGAEGVADLYKKAVTYDEKFRTGGIVGESPSQVVGAMISDAIYVAPTTQEIDWDSIEEDLGVTIDLQTRELIGDSYTVPGSVDIATPALIEKPTFQELEQIEKRGVTGAMSKASSELDKISARLSALTTRDADAGLSEVEKAERDWLITRQNSITSATDSVKNDNLAPLISLYGGDYMKSLIDYYGPKLEGAPINQAFFEAAQTPIDMGSEENYARLYAAGIITNGQLVTYVDSNGETVTEIVGQ